MKRNTTLTAVTDPFFIGWLPIPRSYTRFLAAVALGLVGFAAAFSIVVSSNQDSSGTGVWNDDETTLEGVVYAEPFAMIRVPGAEPNSIPVSVLLIGEGKFGTNERVRPFDGHPVRVTGTLLHRDGRQMLELGSDQDAIMPIERDDSWASPLRRSPSRSLGAATLTGEVVDSKCYLGAMKPGIGKTHRGCAVLCLRGGVPPMLVSRSVDVPEHYMLIGPKGESAIEQVIDHVGETVEVDGQIEAWDDLKVVSVTTIRGK